MTAGYWAGFVFLFIFLYGCIFAAQIPIKRLKPKQFYIVTGVMLGVKPILAIVFALLFVYIDSLITWKLSWVWACLNLIFVVDWFVDLIVLITRLATKHNDRYRKIFAANLFRGICALSIGTVYFSYACANMQTVTPNYHQYSSDKIKKDYKFIFIADAHVSRAQNRSVFEKMISDIKSEKPDYLFLGGDITDEYTTYSTMQYVYSQIGSINVPTYFIYGNHDLQTKANLANGKQYTQEQLVTEITNNNITILADQQITLNDDIVLLGLKSKSQDRKPISEYTLDKNKYSIVLSHEPMTKSEISTLGPTLGLFGHTHGGQLFPFGLCEKLGTEFCAGEHHYGSSTLVTTNGCCGWSAPVRTVGHNHFEVFNLKKI